MTTRLKLTISTIALLALLGHIFWDRVQLDSVALGLIALAMTPWIAHVLKEVQVPGVKISLKDVEAAAEKIQKMPQRDTMALESRPPKPAYLAIADLDPNLALTGLRLEIEKRIRGLASIHGVPSDGTLRRIVDSLGSKRVLAASTAAGLTELIDAGNKAAHGAVLDGTITNWAATRGPEVLQQLDNELARAEVGDDLQAWLEKALTIIDFEDPPITEFCVPILEQVTREDSILLAIRTVGGKARAREVLDRLGALSVDTENPGSGRFIRYRITNQGTVLHANLVAR